MRHLCLHLGPGPSPKILPFHATLVLIGCVAVMPPLLTTRTHWLPCSHAAIPRNTITFISNQVEPLLKLPRPARKAQGDYNYGTGEEQYQAALQAYDDLCKQLRSLKDLPLNVNTIQGVSPVFRYSEVGGIIHGV